jgi:hypothetical protein
MNSIEESQRFIGQDKAIKQHLLKAVLEHDNEG